MNYLDQYYPETNVFDVFKVEQGLDARQTAFNAWKTLIAAKQSHVGLFLVIGKLLRDFKRDKMYEVLDYETFAEFLASEELGFSQESAYMYIRTYEFYIEELGLDPEEVSKMNLGRLSLLLSRFKKMDVREDRAEIIREIEEAHTLRHNDFIRQIKQERNSDGKPDVYYSKEQEKWVVCFYEDTTTFQTLGLFANREKTP